MQADTFKKCVRKAYACVTSHHAFKIPIRATNDLKASDIAFNRAVIKQELDDMYETPLIPDRVTFNACVDTGGPMLNDSENKKYFLYAVAVHEGGHALGLVDWSQFALLSPDYRIAHPSATGSVMYYDDSITVKNDDEPDCAPHLLDIMAIFALYQVVP